VAWRVAIETRDRPVALALNAAKTLRLSTGLNSPRPTGLRRGAYVLADAPDGRPDLVLIGTGSEVSLAVAARRSYRSERFKRGVVSMPSWELFDLQPKRVSRLGFADVTAVADGIDARTARRRLPLRTPPS